MQQNKVKVQLSGRSASMLGCLWGRAQMSREYSSLFYDAKAIELAEKIEYVHVHGCCSTSDVPPFQDIMFDIFHEINVLGPFTLRIKQFDAKIRTYIAQHPRASVICLAAGLDATFYRVDNGLIRWYDLDLPAVIEVRKQLLPEPDRVTYIAKSLLDPSWYEDIKHTEDGVFIMAEAVLPFFEESEIKQFFSMLANNFPCGEIVFEVPSKLGTDIGAWIGVVPQEQRNAMRTATIEAMKDWWEKAPQNQKDTLHDMIATLKTATKPKSKEWADIEVWWNQLSDKGQEWVVRDLLTSFSRDFIKWALEDANEITRWDSRIILMDQFPIYRNIPRDSLSVEIRQFMDYSDENTLFNIIHLRL